MLTLHNTLTQSTEVFIPQTPHHVTMYTCGPTVYSTPHIGNWAAYIRWDTLVRLLRAHGFNVNRVMNITDVGHLVSDADEGEDKMQKGARREGVSCWDIAERYTAEFLDGMHALNLITPDTLCRATDHIDEQIALIRTLENKGYTYTTSDGVYYDTSKFPHYAQFARLDLLTLQAGARVGVHKEKRHAADFALWKYSPTDVQRDMEWDSPWGKGFPGWHIECSAMAMKYLGETIDIHTGGIDHIPVHHTNEIAQSEAASGKRFARYWLHCTHLLSNGTKLSKSLNNSYTLDDLTRRGFSPLDFRMFILQSHYRTETNFTFENLGAAHNRLHRWKRIALLRWQVHDTLVDDVVKDTQSINGLVLAAPHAALEALNDDLNTPAALAVLERSFDAIETIAPEQLQRSALEQLIEWIDDTLGLRLAETTPDISEDTKRLILERQRAREANDWERADNIRTTLHEQGIVVRDANNRTIWSYAD